MAVGCTILSCVTYTILVVFYWRLLLYKDTWPLLNKQGSDLLLSGTSAANLHAPVLSASPCFRIRGGQVPYMTQQWRRAIRLRNRLWKKYFKQCTESTWLDYKKQRNICTSLWRKAIAGYFHNKAKVSEAKPQEFWKLFAPIFKSKCSGHTNDINLIEDNTFVSNKCDIANIFNNFFVNIAFHPPEPCEEQSSNHPSVIKIGNVMQNHSSSDQFMFKSTNSTMVMEILKSLSPSKAVGHDNIPARLIKDGACIIADPLTQLFNSSIGSNSYPSHWKYGQVTPVFKKGDENLKSNYRPITVLVAFNNVLERLLSKQLYNYFEDKLSPYLSAYRRHYSCQTALLRLVEESKIAFHKKEHAALIGIDLSKAFDCLPHKLLLSKLKAYGLSISSIQYLRSYLTNRYQRVKIGDVFSSWLEIHQGVPQGSVLGPLLFNIFLNDLLFKSTNSNLFSYADDTQLLLSGPDPTAIQTSLNYDLALVSEWFQSNGMLTNPEKCLFMWLGKQFDDITVSIDGTEVQNADAMKLLGVYIDSGLHFNIHVKEIVRKISSKLQELKRHKRLISTHAKMRIYMAYFLPHLTYCSIVWIHCGKQNADKLERLNESILCFVFSDHHSSYEKLLENINKPSLRIQRIHDMLVLVYLALNRSAPKYICDLLVERNSCVNLRGKRKLIIPSVDTTRFGLHSFCYYASKSWNSLPDNVRTSPFLSAFKTGLRTVEFYRVFRCKP